MLMRKYSGREQEISWGVWGRGIWAGVGRDVVRERMGINIRWIVSAVRYAQEMLEGKRSWSNIHTYYLRM
jgi:hypothetical protein